MKAYTYISGEAVSGALILTPSFNRLQKSSSICTPGYGDAPEDVKQEDETVINMSCHVWITLIYSACKIIHSQSLTFCLRQNCEFWKRQY